MLLTILLTTFINIAIIFLGYRIILSRIEKKLINQNVIDQIKDEINKIIVNLNNTTHSSISVVEERTSRLNKLLALTDKKIADLSGLTKPNLEVKKRDLFSESEIDENFTYSQKKIVTQSQKMVEIKNKDNAKNLLIEDEIKNLSISEKVHYLFEIGKTKKEIKEIVGLSSGELELLLNIEKSYNN